MSASEEDILNYINSVDKEKAEFNAADLGVKPDTQAEIGQEGQEESMIQSVYDVAQGMNDSFLNLLDIPNNVFDWSAEKLGSDLRVGSVRQLSAETLGVGTKEGRETSSYRAGEYLGMGLEFMAPILKIGKVAPAVEKIVFQGGKPVVTTQAPSLGKSVAQQITKPFVASPKAAMAIETASGLGAGYGSYYGEEEYGEIGAQVGALAAGIFPALSTIPMHLMKNYALKSIFPFTDAGSHAKGGEIIRQLRELPGVEEAIKKETGRVLPKTRHTSARLTKDPHLIALEKVLIKEHPELEHQLAAIDAENNVISKVALRELGGDGAVEDSIRSLGSKFTKLKVRLDLRVDKALDNVKKKMSDLSPRNKRQVVNIETNNQIKSALTDARKAENIVWGEVDKTAQATTSESKAALNKIYSEMEAEADKKIIPSFVNEWLGSFKNGALTGGKWGSQRHVGGIQQLRSRVLQEINNEKFGESVNWNKVRVLEDLEEAMLKDMSNSPASQSIDDALQFSRELNKKFKGDIMSMILKNSRAGGSLAPELTLDSLGGGPKGAFYIKRILAASPESKSNIEDVIKMDMVQQKIFKEEGMNIQKAKDYMSHNEDTMKMFPNLKADMDDAISVAEVHKYFEGSAQARMAKAEKALGYTLADKAQPGTFLNKVLSSKDPEKSMARVMRQMNDKGRSGIKSDVVDMIFNKAKATSEELVGEAGEETFRLSGKKAVGFWNENKKVLSRAFDKQELDRLDVILNTLRLGDTPKGLPTGVAEKALVPKNTVISFAIGTLAARAGAKLGAGTSGASLRTASMATKAAQKILGNLDVNATKNLLIDSIQDKELFIALSQDVTKVQLNQKAMGVLQGWMLAHTVSRLEESREQ